MRKLILGCALALAFVSGAQAQEMDRAQEYRMWSAEQMINRLTEKAAQHNVGSQITAPLFKNIREYAMGGDPVLWAKVVDLVHDFEVKIEAPRECYWRGTCTSLH